VSNFTSTTNGNGHLGEGKNNGIGDPTTPRAVAIILSKVQDKQGYEIWVIYSSAIRAFNAPLKRSMIMAFSRDVKPTLVRQIAHLVAQNYGLPGFVEEG
jgi:hypothetical protein